MLCPKLHDFIKSHLSRQSPVPHRCHVLFKTPIENYNNLRQAVVNKEISFVNSWFAISFNYLHDLFFSCCFAAGLFSWQSCICIKWNAALRTACPFMVNWLDVHAVWMVRRWDFMVWWIVMVDLYWPWFSGLSLYQMNQPI